MDSWLAKHFVTIRGLQTILELGCGHGNDTMYLSATGHRIISCDIAEDQLEIVREKYPDVQTVNFDLRERFPFEPAMADIVIAGLCLHFFTGHDQKKILGEIARVLKPGGKFLCRLNSSKGRILNRPGETDLGYGYYMTKGGLKRFYNEDMIKAAFSDWEIVYIDEYETVTYSKNNTVFELDLRLK